MNDNEAGKGPPTRLLLGPNRDGEQANVYNNAMTTDVGCQK